MTFLNCGKLNIQTHNIVEIDELINRNENTNYVYFASTVKTSRIQISLIATFLCEPAKVVTLPDGKHEQSWRVMVHPNHYECKQCEQLSEILQYKYITINLGCLIYTMKLSLMIFMSSKVNWNSIFIQNLITRVDLLITLIFTVLVMTLWTEWLFYEPVIKDIR